MNVVLSKATNWFFASLDQLFPPRIPQPARSLTRGGVLSRSWADRHMAGDVRRSREQVTRTSGTASAEAPGEVVGALTQHLGTQLLHAPVVVMYLAVTHESLPG